MAEGSAELELFRRQWREELAGGAKRRRREAAAEPPAEPESRRSAEPPELGYLALARGLLDGGGPPGPAPRSPAPARPAGPPAGDGGGDGDDLLGQLIRDLVGLAALGSVPGEPGGLWVWSRGAVGPL